VKAEFKLYELEKGAAPTLERSYSGAPDEVRRLVHRFCNELVAQMTGEPGFFGSPIAFVARKRQGSSVMWMGFDGNGLRSLTKNDSANILPAISPTGGQVAFTSFMRGNPDLYVVASGGGRPKRVAKYAGMNTGASWSPDGTKLALTLSRDGNPEIY